MVPTSFDFGQASVGRGFGRFLPVQMSHTSTSASARRLELSGGQGHWNEVFYPTRARGPRAPTSTSSPSTRRCDTGEDQHQLLRTGQAPISPHLGEAHASGLEFSLKLPSGSTHERPPSVDDRQIAPLSELGIKPLADAARSVRARPVSAESISIQ